MAFPWCLLMEKDISFSYKGTNPLMRPPFWPNLNLVFSQRLHLWIPNHCGLSLQQMNLGAHKHFINVKQTMAKWDLFQKCKIELTFKKKCDLLYHKDTWKAFDKLQYLLLIMLCKLRIEGNFLNLIKDMYAKPTANIIFNSERLHV